MTAAVLQLVGHHLTRCRWRF